MRVLFVQVSREGAAEYSSHRTMAAQTDPSEVQSVFLWQKGTDIEGRPDENESVRDVYHDFGRDMSIEPRPSRVRRGLMMVAGFPSGVVRLGRLIRQMKPDVIYTSQQQYDVLLGSAFSLLFRVPHIIHVHYPFGPWLGKRTAKTIMRTPRLVAVSNFIREDLIRGGARPEQVFVRHSVVPLDRFGCPGRTGAIRSEWGWSPDVPVIVAVGRLDPSKGHMLLLEALAIVVRDYPDARLLVCGTAMQPGYDTRILARTEELGLGAHVVFAGNRTDMPEIYADADIFCLPTEDDACPLVFLEAMAAGLPAVAVVSGGVPEMVVHQETGLLSSPGDVEGLARSLRSLLQDGDLRRTMGAAGKARVAAQFSPERAAAQWTTVLQALVPARPQPGNGLAAPRRDS